MDLDELRYSKQLILEGFGKNTQYKLKASSILIIGAGGLGSPALLYLGAAGLGKLGIVDFDTVTYSNLNRQILYTTEDIGKKKVHCAEKRIRALNPEVEIEVYDTRLDINNAEEIISKYDVVVDASDNFSTRYLVSDGCYFLKKPLVEGAATAYDGILMSIVPGETPCYRCLYPHPPEEGNLPTCSDVGIIGMLTGMVGSAQALEAIKLLGAPGEGIKGRLLLFDALASSFREINWKKRKDCPLCGNNPKIHEISEYEIKCKSKANF